MLTQQIRRAFLNYFQKQGHSIIASSPVVPHDDPTLLFTNAGMNQFKDVFLGNSRRDYKRATTSQKCVRVGGKHNDLENVGHTRRHLTFFEMLGNFSFGDYFKADAIRFAWEVSTQVFGLDPNRIWPTVFREDDEAFELWTKYVPAERITRFDEKDNFWSMGETGPCGPCSELLYDRGEHYGKGKRPSEDPSGERFLEYWNLVFMQYNRQVDGAMLPLPKPSIDTGVGLERVVSLKMNVDSVFETDVLRSLITQVEKISGITYHHTQERKDPAFRVIADHMRCLAFAIADGVQPSNIDRGYVLRKILRRAVRYGRTLGLEEPFMAKVLPALISAMGEDYPELIAAQHLIAEILTKEEESFMRTLRRGGNLLNNIIEKAQETKKISGDDAFKLKDTYGFPLEEISLLALDAGLTVDTERYLILEKEAKDRSRSAHKTTNQIAEENLFADFTQQHGACEFVGYTQQTSLSIVTALVVEGQFVDEMKFGQEGMVLLNMTPFYAEMGGQVGDQGVLKNHESCFIVNDCESPYKGVIAHQGKLESGKLSIGDSLVAEIDTKRRQKIGNNHTATHLLHWALHRILGGHIKQAGSVVDATHLRFDFNHHKALTKQEIDQIEDLINTKIREDISVKGYELTYEEAQKNHEIKQFFGEKYGAIVRVIDIDYSKELCGGTHTSSVGTIGLFRIVKESSIAAGVRRIEAVTGEEAEHLVRQQSELVDRLASILKTQPHQLLERVEKLLDDNKALNESIKASKQKVLSSLSDRLVEKTEKIHGVDLITGHFSADLKISSEELRFVADEILNKLSSGIVILANISAVDVCQLLIRISDDIVAKGIKANDLIKVLAPIIEGTGGGKPNYAQAGGKAPDHIVDVFEKAKELLENLC